MRLCLLRAGDDDVGEAVDPSLQTGEEPEQRATRRQEAVIEHLRAETALVIEHQRATEQPRYHSTDQRALVQVRVNHVHALTDGGYERGRGEQQVEVGLVPVRADPHAPLPGQTGHPHDADTGHRIAGVVGAERNLVAKLLERANLLQDTDVAAVVGEERRRSNAEYVIWHSTPYASTRQHRLRPARL